MRDGAFRRYVDRLAAGRPVKRQRKPGKLTDEQAAQLRTAIAVRAGRAEGGVSAEFANALQQRLAAELDPAPAQRQPTITRRRLVQATSLAAASALAGAAIEQTLAGPDLQVGEPAETLLPSAGTWRTVAASTELEDGTVCGFDLGAVNGFVQRRDGHLLAVSGVCTHLGCRLVLSAPMAGAELECPCHRAAFTTDGAVIRYELPQPLRPLPRFAVREIDGSIQVYAPA